MEYKDDFQAYYESELLPVLQGLEKERKASFIKACIAGAVIIIVSVAAAFVVAELAEDEYEFVTPLWFGFFTFGIVTHNMTRGYRGRFKKTIIKKITHYVDPSLAYKSEEMITPVEFVESAIFRHRIDSYSGEDLIVGKVGKTEMRFSEVHAQYKTTSTDSKGRSQTYWHDIFNGLFFIADFNKQFQGQTVVLPDTAEKLLGGVGKKLQEWNLSRDDLVKLEDPEFEKEFVVYSTDQVEARYILSLSLMRRILEFKRKVRVPLHLSFVGGNLYMAIGIKRDMFEPRNMQTILDVDLMREYLGDVNLAVGIVEDLNLNLRIWTKK